MNNIALGRYIPANTIIHKLDPRIKLVGMIVLMVTIFLNFGTVTTNFIFYALIFLILLTIMIIGKISFISIFKSLKALWLMIIFLLIINIFTTRSGTPAFTMWDFVVYWEGIIRTLYIIVRLMLMIMLTTILTASTKPLELTFALEWILSPFKLVKLPVHIIAMTLSLTLRFIPTLIEEANKIMRAQASRGVDFKEGKLKEKFRAIISLIIPLFVSCFIRSGELADAMEARGYNPTGKRTKFNRRKWSINDTIDIIVISAFLAGVITMAVFQPDIVGLISGAI